MTLVKRVISWFDTAKHDGAHTMIQAYCDLLVSNKRGFATLLNFEEEEDGANPAVVAAAETKKAKAKERKREREDNQKNVNDVIHRGNVSNTNNDAAPGDACTACTNRYIGGRGGGGSLPACLPACLPA